MNRRELLKKTASPLLVAMLPKYKGMVVVNAMPPEDKIASVHVESVQTACHRTGWKRFVAVGLNIEMKDGSRVFYRPKPRNLVR